MRILVTGALGMLGRDLVAVLSSHPEHTVLPADLPGFDITERQAIRDAVREMRPDAVIHAAAYTDVDGCEKDAALAMKVNGEGTRNVVEAASEAGARLLYVSTDYVFDGNKGAPYEEEDLPNPLSAYGRSKLAGECAVREYSRGTVVRTSWLFGQHGRHFIGAILERARRGDELRVVHDQTGCPTWSRDLARVLAVLIERDVSGVFHAAGSGSCSWYQFALAILEEARKTRPVPPVEVRPITTAELGRPAPRPALSVLSARRLIELGIAPPLHWRESLRRFLELVP